MFKNVGSQKLTCIAFADAGHASLDAGEPVTGDAANITCKVEQDDDGTQSATNDVNPTEVEDGQYRFDLTQAETNGDKLTFYPQSATAGVQVVCMPSNVIYTRPTSFTSLDVSELNSVVDDLLNGGRLDLIIDAIKAVTDNLPDSGALTTINGYVDELETRLTAARAGYLDNLNGHTAQTGDTYAALPTNFSDLSITLTTGRVDVASIEGSDATDQINAACDTAFTDYDPPTKAELDSGLAALNDPTAAAIADQVWEELIADHSGTSGSTAESLNAAGGAGDPWTTSLPGSYTGTQAGKILADVLDDVTGLNGDAMRGTDSAYTGTPPTAAAITDAVLDEALSGHTTAGTLGKAISDIEADTNELQSDDVPGLIATAQADLDTITGASGALLDSTATSAQLVDDIWDEVITGAQHNVNTSAAKYLRQSSQSITGVTGTLQSATSTTAVLASGAVTADDLLNGERITIIEGTGVGQSRLISDSVALTDTVTVGHAWTTTPDNTSIYAIQGAEVDVRAIAEQPATATASVDFDDLATILLDTGELQTDWTDGGRLDLIIDSILANQSSGVVLTAGERDSVATALLDLSDGVETSLTVRQALRLSSSALGAKVSGMSGNAPIFRDVNDLVNRITATTDADGNRSAVTLNL